jgi:hypothetical protein
MSRALPVATDEAALTDAEACTKCGGSCCQTMPGSMHALKAALDSGQYAIDWWEGDPRDLDYDDPKRVSAGYFVRPAIVGHEGERHHASWGGVCTFWTRDVGCAFPFDARPTGCRALIPDAGNFPGGCHSALGPNEKRAAALAWLPYHAAIETAAGPRRGSRAADTLGTILEILHRHARP